MEFLGIIIHGSAFVDSDSTKDFANLKELKIGDLIGHNVVSEYTERTEHWVSIKAKTYGLIAVLPLNELKIEVRRAPEAVS